MVIKRGGVFLESKTLLVFGVKPRVSIFVVVTKVVTVTTEFV